MAERVSAEMKVDPITYEVLRNAFAAACNEMALVVAKTAYSTPVNEGRDFAGVVYDRHGKLVSQGEFDLPGFVGITQLTVPEVIRAIGLETMKPGDIYMINDPYVASSHCNDIHQIKPIFYQKQLVAFVSSTAHWSDVGGVAPGSLNSTARTHFEEGVRIPAIRIYNQGVLNQDMLNLLLHNMRQSWGAGWGPQRPGGSLQGGGGAHSGADRKARSPDRARLHGSGAEPLRAAGPRLLGQPAGRRLRSGRLCRPGHSYRRAEADPSQTYRRR